jgi:hypothetical protein
MTEHVFCPWYHWRRCVVVPGPPKKNSTSVIRSVPVEDLFIINVEERATGFILGFRAECSVNSQTEPKNAGFFLEQFYRISHSS